jgi:penicillin-binding protein 2
VPIVDLGLDPRVMAVVRRSWYAVVNDPEGTGYKPARSDLVAIAGKTGSAQVSQSATRKPNSWFIGYAPAENPQIAFAVVFEEAGHGGQVAAPVAKKIVETCLKQGLIRN